MRASPARVLAPALAAAVLLLPGSAAGAVPTDPLAAQQQPLQVMRVGEALDHLARPLADVPVLVEDTGIDLTHPDLAPRMLGPPATGSDLIGDPPPCEKLPGQEVPDNDPSDPPSCSSHGTAVAGVLGAAWNNGQGGAGVAPNARFIPMRYCWDNDTCYQYIAAHAYDLAAAAGARVISMSYLESAPLESEYRDAIVNHPNILFVTIPSGNGGATDAEPDAANRVPCSLDAPNVICVSTSSPSDGLDCGDYGATLVDVAVPTENSITTTNGGGYTPTGCATSFASPTAAGVATILFGLVPQATPADVKEAIMVGARRVPAWQGKSVTGGIVDAAAAVDEIQTKFGLMPPAPSAPQCHGQPATVVGTAQSDKLTGTAKADVIAGLGGADRIKGLAGNDLVCGGGGNDVLRGGPGRDRLFGEGGRDTLIGGPGKDKLAGGPGHDTLKQ